MSNGERYVTRSGKAPSAGQVANQVMGALVSKEPVPGLGWSTASNADGKPLYTVAIIMGSENCNQMDALFKKVVGHMKRVDTFDGEPGQPVEDGA